MDKNKFIKDFWDFSKNYDLPGYRELKRQMEIDLSDKKINSCAQCRRTIIMVKYKKIIEEKYKDYFSS
jgi:hypothetical protein